MLILDIKEQTLLLNKLARCIGKDSLTFQTEMVVGSLNRLGFYTSRFPSVINRYPAELQFAMKHAEEELDRYLFRLLKGIPCVFDIYISHIEDGVIQIEGF